VGIGGSFPVGLFVHGDHLYFSAKWGELFNNPWEYDSDQAARIPSFPDPHTSVVTNGILHDDLYFGADDGLTEMELWKSDGEKIVLVADLNPRAGDSFRRDFTVVDDTLYFKATMQQHGQEVWQYDAMSVSILKDVNPGPKSSDSQYLTERDGALLFLAVAHGQCPVHRFDGHPSKEYRERWGPLEVGDTFLTLRGESIQWRGYSGPPCICNRWRR